MRALAAGRPVTSPPVGAHRWAALLLLAVIGGLGSWLGPATPAAAHAFLVSSSPADGARLAQAPGHVRLEFGEPVELAHDSVKVLTAHGERVDRGKPDVRGASVTIGLRQGLPNGTYVASWRLLSADGHVVGGTIQFGVGTDPSGAPATPSSSGTALATAASAARGLTYAGLVGCIGVFVGSRWLWPWTCPRRRARLLLGAGWLACVLGLGAQLLLLGPRTADTGWAGAARLTGLPATAASPVGGLLLAGLAALLLLAPLLARRRGGAGQRCAALAVATVLLACVTLSGHSSTGPEPWLAALSSWLHLTAMSVWLGGLLLLALVVAPRLRALARQPAGYLEPWSRLAFGCVALLILSGELLAWRQLVPLQSLWSTRYGLLLLLKVGLVGALLAAAWIARRHVERQGAPAAAVLRIELGCAAAVLVVTTFLVAQAPARTVYGPPYTASAGLGTDTVRVTMDSTRRGPVTITAQLYSGTRHPGLSAMLSSTDAGIGKLAVRMEADPAIGGLWRSKGAVIPAPGTWTLTLATPANAATTAFGYTVW